MAPPTSLISKFRPVGLRVSSPDSPQSGLTSRSDLITHNFIYIMGSSVRLSKLTYNTVGHMKAIISVYCLYVAESSVWIGLAILGVITCCGIAHLKLLGFSNERERSAIA